MLANQNGDRALWHDARCDEGVVRGLPAALNEREESPVHAAPAGSSSTRTEPMWLTMDLMRLSDIHSQ